MKINCDYKLFEIQIFDAVFAGFLNFIHQIVGMMDHFLVAQIIAVVSYATDAESNGHPLFLHLRQQFLVDPLD